MKITHSTVFENAEGFDRARIPGIVCTDKGTLIAYCELRQTSDDWSVIDIGIKRSTDGGRTWSQREIAVSGVGRNTVNNPVMIADGETLHFLYCLNYHQVFYRKSTDEGQTWTKEKELTSQIKEHTDSFFWSCIATGPTHGIRLLSGTLVVPCWLAYNREDNTSHHPSVITVLYSEDKGESWKTGKINDTLVDPSEFSVAQLKNGKAFAVIRHEGDKKCRATAEISSDFSLENITCRENLIDPVCCAGLISTGDNLLFVNCNSSEKRENLTLKKLDADFSVCEELFLSKEAGYSDIALSADGKTAYILFEKEKRLEFISVDISYE